MNKILIACVAVLVVAAIALLTYSAISQSSTNYSGKILGVEATNNQSAILTAMKYGIGYFRFDIRNNNATEEALVGNITAAGGNVLGILDYDTLGVSINDGVCTNDCNWTLDDWNQSVRMALSMYPSVHYWEIWNEPTISNFQDGFQNGSAYNYYLMLKSAYQIIKAHNSSDTVVCMGGDNIYEGGPAFDQIGYEWASQLWSYGAGNYCDAISLHVYTEFRYLTNQIPYDSYSNMSDVLDAGLSAYENLTGKPIWITEIGIPSNGGNNSAQSQATFINQTTDLFLSKPYVKGFFWFKLEGTIDPPDNLDMGLLNQTTLKAKPAMLAYSRIAK